MESKKWAFLVGIDKYDELSSFDYCARHVKELKKILIKEGGYPEENIKILPTREGIPVSRSDIIKEFPRFLWQMDEEYNHTFLIYFVGHGAYHHSLYLLTSDSLVDASNPRRIEQTGINIKWFEEELSTHGYQSWNVFMIVDACQTGMLKEHGEDDEDYDEEESEKLLASLPSGISYLYSCKPMHKGFPFKEKKEFNSIFSFALIESLRTLPKPIRFGEVVEEVKSRAYKLSRRYGKSQQYPIASGDITAFQKILLGDKLPEESKEPVTQEPKLITQEPELITTQDAYFNKGKIFHEMGQYEKALVEYTEVIKRDKNHAEAYFMRGKAYQEMEQYAEAMRDYDKAILLNPKIQVTIQEPVTQEPESKETSEFSYLRTKIGNIKPKKWKERIVENLEKLKTQLQQEIPPRTSTQTLLLANWNMYRSGVKRSTPYKRLDESLIYISEIISSFDVIVLQEISKYEKREVEELMNILGNPWKYISVSFIRDDVQEEERMLFIYDSSKIKLVRSASKMIFPEEPGFDTRFYRPPFTVSFAKGKFRFNLLNLHLHYGRDTLSSIDVKQRIQEFRVIAQTITSRAKHENVNFILIGDFLVIAPPNLVKQTLRMNKFTVPINFWHAPVEPVQFKYNHDQIAYKKVKGVVEYGGRSGFFNFYESVFRDDEAELYISKYKKGFGEYITQQEEDKAIKYYLERWRAWQMSAYLPTWVELEIKP